MSSLADRLRGVVRSGGSNRLRQGDGGPPELHAKAEEQRPPYEGIDPQPLLPDPDLFSDPASILGGEWQESSGQRFVTVDRTYLPGHRHGRVSVADGLPPSDGLWPRLSLLAGASSHDTVLFPDGKGLLFLDLETTGLAGGAGTQAFLVGCAWFDGGTFRIRQFFLSSLAAERAMLEAISELAAAIGGVVTYNGKTFDLPVIETRFLFHRLETPFAGLPHVDMLHPARRLWRQAVATNASEAPPGLNPGSCRLSIVEGAQCGHVRDHDVLGLEIPARYFHFVRTGDARMLAGVFEHNRLDLLSLAMLTARAAQLLEEGPAVARTAREALGLGRLFERGGLLHDARACYARAAGLEAAEFTGDSTTQVEALRAYALLSRRERRHDEAAMAWRRVLEMPGSPPRLVREAVDALAVYHEHRQRNLLIARRFALQSLEFQGTPARTQAIRHRLARLGRKLERHSEDRPLFYECS